LTPEEVAAVTAVTVAVRQREEAAARANAVAERARPLNAWVDASRRSAQRALLQRGPWRLSGRIGRRSRT
jgi:hypothetical protein